MFSLRVYNHKVFLSYFIFSQGQGQVIRAAQPRQSWPLVPSLPGSNPTFYKLRCYCICMCRCPAPFPSQASSYVKNVTKETSQRFRKYNICLMCRLVDIRGLSSHTGLSWFGLLPYFRNVFSGGNKILFEQVKNSVCLVACLRGTSNCYKQIMFTRYLLL